MNKFFVFLLLCLPVVAQTLAPKTPRPYGEGSFNLMPPGYASVAWGLGGGIMWDMPHLVFNSFLGYDNGHKENDATSNNNKGHDRFLRGFAAYKVNSTYFGVGARWSQLSTTNYTKGGPIYAAGSWHPEIGLGHDFFPKDKFYPLFMRAQIAYMFKESKEVVHYPDGSTCYGCGSGVYGVDMSVWFPSPAKNNHLFLRMNIVLFGFHDSITDPSNKILTRIQSGNTHLGDSTEFMLMYRF